MNASVISREDGEESKSATFEPNLAQKESTVLMGES